MLQAFIHLQAPTYPSWAIRGSVSCTRSGIEDQISDPLVTGRALYLPSSVPPNMTTSAPCWFEIHWPAWMRCHYRVNGKISVTHFAPFQWQSYMTPQMSWLNVETLRLSLSLQTLSLSWQHQELFLRACCCSRLQAVSSHITPHTGRCQHLQLQSSVYRCSSI